MARDLFARQGDLTPQYFVYCKEDQRRMAEKGLSCGHLDIFQTMPRAWGTSLPAIRKGFLLPHSPGLVGIQTVIISGMEGPGQAAQFS